MYRKFFTFVLISLGYVIFCKSAACNVPCVDDQPLQSQLQLLASASSFLADYSFPSDRIGEEGITLKGFDGKVSFVPHEISRYSETIRNLMESGCFGYTIALPEYSVSILHALEQVFLLARPISMKHAIDLKGQGSLLIDRLQKDEYIKALSETDVTRLLSLLQVRLRCDPGIIHSVKQVLHARMKKNKLDTFFRVHQVIGDGYHSMHSLFSAQLTRIVSAAQCRYFDITINPQFKIYRKPNDIFTIIDTATNKEIINFYGTNPDLVCFSEKYCMYIMHEKRCHDSAVPVPTNRIGIIDLEIGVQRGLVIDKALFGSSAPKKIVCAQDGICALVLVDGKIILTPLAIDHTQLSTEQFALLEKAKMLWLHRQPYPVGKEDLEVYMGLPEIYKDTRLFVL